MIPLAQSQTASMPLLVLVMLGFADDQSGSDASYAYVAPSYFEDMEVDDNASVQMPTLMSDWSAEADEIDYQGYATLSRMKLGATRLQGLRSIANSTGGKFDASYLENTLEE